MIAWGLKESQKEEVEVEYRDELPIKRPQPLQRIIEHKEVDYEQIKRLTNITIKKTINPSLEGLARLQPEQITPERSMNLQAHFNTEPKRDFNDVKELFGRRKKPTQKKK